MPFVDDSASRDTNPEILNFEIEESVDQTDQINVFL